MTVQNSEQTSSAVIVFQGRVGNREYRIIAEDGQLYYEEATEWDRIGSPRFKKEDPDTGEAALIAFALEAAKSLEDGSAKGKQLWQGENPKGHKVRVVIVDGEAVVCQEAKEEDLLGAPLFQTLEYPEDVLEQWALEQAPVEKEAIPLAEASSHEGLGWHCDHSPDSHCHYYSDEDDSGQGRVVRLNNGEKNPLPTDHDHHRENPDNCIYCGEPEERK